MSKFELYLESCGCKHKCEKCGCDKKKKKDKDGKEEHTCGCKE